MAWVLGEPSKKAGPGWKEGGGGWEGCKGLVEPREGLSLSAPNSLLP